MRAQLAEASSEGARLTEQVVALEDRVKQLVQQHKTTEEELTQCQLQLAGVQTLLQQKEADKEVGMWVEQPHINKEYGITLFQ